MKHIVIIGGGTSAMFVLNQLSELLCDSGFKMHDVLKITFFDGGSSDRKSFGDENSFGEIPSFLISNTTNASIDALLPSWKEFRAARGVQNEVFSARSLFGTFGKAVLSESVRKLRNVAEFEIISESVRNIERIHTSFSADRADKLLIRSDSEIVIGDYVFIATGNTKIASFESDEEVLQAYGNGISLIPKDASIGIVGTGLRAVDVLSSLFENGHQGKITAASRHGRLPRVQPPKGAMSDYAAQLPQFDVSFFADRPPTLNSLLKFLAKDFVNNRIPAKHVKNLLKTEKTDVLTWNTEIVDSSKGDRRWYCRSFQLTSQMEDCWPHLTEDEQIEFVRFYRSQWISNIIGIPPVAAYRIKNLFDRGILKTLSGFDGVSKKGPENKGALVLKSFSENNEEVDVIIDASQYGLGGGKQHPIIKSLVSNSIANTTALGRLIGNLKTMELTTPGIHFKGKIYGIGELMMGPNFCPSSIESNLKMARTAVAGFQEHFSMSATWYNAHAEGNPREICKVF